jgi:hypothetical protein
MTRMTYDANEAFERSPATINPPRSSIMDVLAPRYVTESRCIPPLSTRSAPLSTAQRCPVPHSAAQCRSVPLSAAQCRSVLLSAAQCSSAQPSAALESGQRVNRQLCRADRCAEIHPTTSAVVCRPRRISAPAVAAGLICALSSVLFACSSDCHYCM